MNDNRKRMGIIFMAAGVVLLCLGIFIYTSDQKAQNQADTISNVSTANNSGEAEYSAPTQIDESSQQVANVDDKDDADSHEKGRQFEEYIVSRFSKRYWKLESQTNDDMVAGRYIESAKQPDLQMSITLRARSFKNFQLIGAVIFEQIMRVKEGAMRAS